MTKDSLKVQINKLSDNRMAVEIEVPAERCKSTYEEALSSLSKSISIPGFRSGNVPKSIVVQQIGISRIKAHAIERLVDRVWKEVIAQESLEPASEAELKEELQSLVDRFKPNEKNTFTIHVEI